ARHRLENLRHIRHIYTTIGGGATGSDIMAADGNSDVRMATLTLLLDPRKERPEKHIIENDIRAAMATLPGTRS
ncbi:hypothetical protein, partial [Klebsiella pneumoniae]